jgi:hypothetical protein
MEIFNKWNHGLFFMVAQYRHGKLNIFLGNIFHLIPVAKYWTPSGNQPNACPNTWLMPIKISELTINS